MIIDVFTYVFIALFGLVIGSFLNVCIYRIPLHNFFGDNRSYCPTCKHHLAWYDLVPLFSYLFLLGKCRYCKQKISPRYPIVESITSIAFCLCYYAYGLNILTLIFIVASALLIIISGIDYDTMEIPNGLVITLLCLGIINFVLSFFNMSVALWWEHLIGMVALSAFLYLMCVLSGGGVGGGDIKLTFACGLLLGYKLLLLATLVAFVSGAIIGLILMLTKKKSGKTKLPLGPFLAFGFMFAMYFGQPIITAYLNLVNF